jgi:hypothetical protein
MNHFTLPLQIKKGSIERSEDLKRSIDTFLSVLITTPCNSSIADRRFGFIFNNLRFEIFNEREGVVYDSTTDDDTPEKAKDILYDLKISGSSKNLNTFASELKEAITYYEHRLSDVSVAMTYVREERRIYISVKAIIASTEEKYKYTTTINVWN